MVTELDHCDKPPLDYLGLDDLLSFGLDESLARILLRDSPLSGHDARSVLAADDLPDLLAAWKRFHT